MEIRWTPDRANLIILTEETADDPSQSGFSIFVYNFERDDLAKLVDKNSLNSLYSSDEFEEPRVHISNLSNEILSLSDTLQDGYFEVNLQTGEVIQTDDLGTRRGNIRETPLWDRSREFLSTVPHRDWPRREER